MLALARNLPFYAGTAAAYGLSKEEALKLITINPAEILGVGDKTGSLVEGKEATLFVSQGDALDFRTNNLSHAYIQGKKIVLDNKQEALFERFSKKYGSED
jgi:imidazolonepropionase-like amidohydrolase